ncbi:hypothetical protein [uncultured Paludibaculum sp.]|uniref:hypothetical protein n=1 Tax=uncultured Paludibaculum sp. TaxID=1765020 RepID=UPI002AAAC4E1|nr:hypothetical protein [uncultured Paludibaculum sp.]
MDDLRILSVLERQNLLNSQSYPARSEGSTVTYNELVVQVNLDVHGGSGRFLMSREDLASVTTAELASAVLEAWQQHDCARLSSTAEAACAWCAAMGGPDSGDDERRELLGALVSLIRENLPALNADGHAASTQTLAIVQLLQGLSGSAASTE